MSLQGIRVIDLTRIISGPFCTQLLADLGADVIKIETLSGDPLRAQGEMVNDFSWYFAGYNRNKRSIAIDLYSDKGKEILLRLLNDADVLVENFRPGVLDKMGLTKEVLGERSPDLIVCHISGFGADGPYAQRPAFDFIAQALSGFMSVNGSEDDPPLRSGLPVSDLVVGLFGALGVVSRIVGLLNKNETVKKVADQKLDEDKSTGVQSVDVSLTDSMVSLLSFMAADYLAAGKIPTKNGNDHPLVAPYGLFNTKDSSIAIAPSNDGVYVKLLSALGMEELLEDERINTNAKRMANRPLLRSLFNPVFEAQTSEYWIKHLNDAGVPAGSVLTVPEVLNHEQIKHREMVMEVDHGERGVVSMLGFPMKFDHEPCTINQPAPKLGEHSAELLTESGYSMADIEKFQDAKIIGSHS